jgi:hypothetical protein
MIEIRPTCRNRFTPADFDFIATALASDLSQRESLTRLFQDHETLDLILDQERLFQALLEDQGLLSVSSHFYFYVLVRQVLLRAECDDRELADYVASLLAAFSSTRRARRPLAGVAGAADYLVDMLRAMEEADERTRFALTLHLGNYALYLSGIFPEFIEQRARRRAAPGLAYYEALGSSHFNAAGSHRLAVRYDLAPVLATLATQFTPTRKALNDLSERLLIWRDINLP